MNSFECSWSETPFQQHHINIDKQSEDGSRKHSFASDVNPNNYFLDPVSPLMPTFALETDAFTWGAQHENEQSELPPNNSNYTCDYDCSITVPSSIEVCASTFSSSRSTPPLCSSSSSSVSSESSPQLSAVLTQQVDVEYSEEEVPELQLEVDEIGQFQQYDNSSFVFSPLSFDDSCVQPALSYCAQPTQTQALPHVTSPSLASTASSGSITPPSSVTLSGKRRTRYTTAAAACTRTAIETLQKQHHGKHASITALSSDAELVSSDYSHSNTGSSMDEDDEQLVSSTLQCRRASTCTSVSSSGLPHSAKRKLSNSAANDHQPMPSKQERNKLSASLYRKRRKLYLDSLEGRVETMSQQLQSQQETIKLLNEQNARLQQQLQQFQANASRSSNARKSTNTSFPTHPTVTPPRQSALKTTGLMLFLVCALLIMYPFSSSSPSQSSSVAPSRPGRTLLSFDPQIDITLPSFEHNDIELEDEQCPFIAQFSALKLDVASIQDKCECNYACWIQNAQQLA